METLIRPLAPYGVRQVTSALCSLGAFARVWMWSMTHRRVAQG